MVNPLGLGSTPKSDCKSLLITASGRMSGR